MKLVGIDADNGSILCVQASNMEGILATKDNIIVEFVPLISN